MKSFMKKTFSAKRSFCTLLLLCLYATSLCGCQRADNLESDFQEIPQSNSKQHSETIHTKMPDATRQQHFAATSQQANASGSAMPPEDSSDYPDNLTDLDNTIQNWGQGVQFNEKNQPQSSVDFQNRYQHLNASFIGPDKKQIWLTFDEGYENGYTERILNTLKEKDCPAVFFITGQYAQENPELIQRMIQEGHSVGNHSWAHPSSGMPSLSLEQQVADFQKLHQYVADEYQYEMTLFRYPAGIFSEQSLALMQSQGYHSLFWSFAYADWDPNQQPDPDQTLNKLTERLHPGAIYLLHAVSATNANVLGEFIDNAREMGYEFVLPETTNEATRTQESTEQNRKTQEQNTPENGTENTKKQ